MRPGPFLPAARFNFLEADDVLSKHAVASYFYRGDKGIHKYRATIAKFGVVLKLV